MLLRQGLLTLYYHFACWQALFAEQSLGHQLCQLLQGTLTAAQTKQRSCRGLECKALATTPINKERIPPSLLARHMTAEPPLTLASPCLLRNRKLGLAYPQSNADILEYLAELFFGLVAFCCIAGEELPPFESLKVRMVCKQSEFGPNLRTAAATRCL